MPKILRIINRFNLGGPTYNVAYLTKYISNEYETLLIGGDKEEGEDSSTFILENLGIKPILLPELKRDLSFSNDIKAYKAISKIIKEFKPDIVHTHASKAGAIGRLAAIRNNVPVVVHTFHGHVFHSYFGTLKTKFYLAVERYLAKRSSAIIAISEMQKAELLNEYKIAEEEKFAVINLGFDLQRFMDNETINRKKFREHYQVSESEIAVVIVGRLAPVKNHLMFIRALNYAVKNSNQKIRAFIIGDGEMRQQIEMLVTSLGLDYVDFTKEERVATITFTSWITDVERVLTGSDVVCLTSFNEGTPVSLIEAQASSRPIITTNVGGIADIVSANAAILVESDDYIQFGKSIKQLAESPDLRREMSSAGKDFVKSRFHYNRLIKDMEYLYSKLLQKK